MASINEQNVSSFYGTVPAPMELAFMSVCLGAPITYEKLDNTSQESACMLVPKKDGTAHPIVVTFGNEDASGKSLRSADYVFCGVEAALNSPGQQREILADRFISMMNLAENNDYIASFYEPKIAELAEKLRVPYAQHMKDFEEEAEAYKKVLAEKINKKKIDKTAQNNK